jgi:hypothetical protein
MGVEETLLTVDELKIVLKIVDGLMMLRSLVKRETAQNIN